MPKQTKPLKTKNKKQKKVIKIAINGFGRIGRAAFKSALDNSNVKVVAINDLTDTKTLAHLLKYDSVYGIYEKEVKSDSKNIIVDGEKFSVLSIKEPEKLPWKKMEVDVVLECTGRFVRDAASKDHLKAGTKKCIISAPAKGRPEVPTYLLGVNTDKYKGEDLISMASCTTNCITPVAKVIDENFKVKKAYLTTIHSYTSTQNIVDGPHKDLRRARAAAANLVPTSTGAAIAAAQAYPRLKERFDGAAVRVPTICGSLSDLVFEVRTTTTPARVNSAFKKAARSRDMKGILQVTTEPIVSSDIIKTEASAIVDLNCTQVLGNNLIKVFAWYDNEWAYAKRLVEMAGLVAEKIK